MISEQVLQAIMNHQSKLTVIENTKAYVSTNTWPNVMSTNGAQVIREALDLLSLQTAQQLGEMYKNATSDSKPALSVSDGGESTETDKG